MPDDRILVQGVPRVASTPPASQDPNGGGDSDGDGVTNSGELALGTDPHDWDSDDDALSDGQETVAGLAAPGRFPQRWERTDPNNADSDDDGLPDGIEVLQAYETGDGRHVTNPNRWDSDGDGLGDGDELAIGLAPGTPDSDDDGIDDGDELRLGTDPLVRDSDQDGLWDGVETRYTGTDPLNPDTDGDRALDGYEEFVSGTDPTVFDPGFEDLGYGRVDPLTPEPDPYTGPDMEVEHYE